MSSNSVRFQNSPNQAFAENFTCLSKAGESPLLSISVFPITHPLFEKMRLQYNRTYDFHYHISLKYLLDHSSLMVHCGALCLLFVRLFVLHTIFLPF